MFEFFTDLSQGDNLLVVSESNLRHAFDRFALAGCPLPGVLQAMFQVRGLHPKYSNLEESLRDGTRK